MIGVFDSGFGGLTILKAIREQLPEYDYLYLGDNARTPYGSRSFEVVYEYTWQAVQYLFSQGCTLVVLACNTASAKALRSIQQRNLVSIWKQEPDWHEGLLGRHRVLGVIRPTVEAVPSFTKSGHVGILATPGTVASESYLIEIAKQSPELIVTQQACPMWVPIIENNEHLSEGADFFVEKYVSELFHKDPAIDTLILGCTHYPLLQEKISASVERMVNHPVRIVAQGTIIASSLADYLTRHADISAACSKGGTCSFLTTESADKFLTSASIFLSEPITALHVELV